MAFERSCFFLFFFFLAIGLASSSPNHISYDALNAHMLGGRGLLEKFYVKNDCPVEFEKEDLSPLIGTCKGPYYNPLVCCNGFTQIACKYAELINNVDNGCSTDLFYVLNKQGGYPNNLFAQICKGDKEGLPCDNKPKGNRGRH
ncbi:hypothetical protein KY290_016710 [Solanum tuberosum]|uniref:GPI-anchored protein LLG1-like domain-containing protein n=1 Tax=Solanum tuberosum TaxID=4113 RepID=A0ABQ7V976_SOLTU|nr:hypothetical protein KY284_015994 [Solanum tuberosum]KAH0760637.1 hypothetical protein KY290_016710 [Solanum tuberosum]